MFCTCTSPGCLCSVFYVPEEQTLVALLTNNQSPETRAQTGTPNEHFLFNISHIKHTA